MDIAIQMRSIELMLKFLKHDLKNVPSYGYALQKRELPEAKAPSRCPAAPRRPRAYAPMPCCAFMKPSLPRRIPSRRMPCS